MTGADLYTQTTDILDGVMIDSNFFYQLLDIAKVKLEEKRLWQYLKKLDSSNTVSSGNNYATAIALPSDFAEDYKVLVGTNTEIFPVPFEEQHLYRNSAHTYYIDVANSNMYVLGNINGGTLYLYYKRFTDAITSSTSPVFPARFHPLLAFYVASYYQNGIDTDDIFAKMSPVNRGAALELEESMISWDTSLKMRSQNDRIGVSDSEPSIFLGDM